MNSSKTTAASATDIQAAKAEELERNAINRECLRMPEGLSAPGRQAYRIIRDFMRRKKRNYLGGCKAFYEPSDWGQHECVNPGSAVLAVVYDGGDLAPIFNPAYEQHKLRQEMMDLLNSCGFVVGPGEHWWTFIHYVPKNHKQRTAYLVFGREAVRAVAEGDWGAVDSVNQVSFETEAELDAYLRGVDDGSGWMEYHQLNEDEEKVYQALQATRPA